MKKLFAYGGIAASVIMIAFGIGAIAVGALGINDVRDNLSKEQIYFGDAAKDPTVPKGLSSEHVTTGAEAREFAKMMRGHALEATSGKTYAQMGRFVAKPGTPANLTDGQGGTNDPKYAAVDPKTKQSVSNPARNIWVTEIALTTALNTAFFAERVGWFSIVMGIALLLTGMGFLVLTLGGALGIAPVHRRQPQLETRPATS